MKLKHLAALALSMVLTLAALAPRSVAAAPPPREAPRFGTPVSIDDLLSQVASLVPAFGGMFVDSDKALEIYLTDPRQAEAAESAIARVFGRDRFDLSRARILTARYGFADLRAWHNRHRLDTLALRGVVMTSIHKSTNRLRVGVESEEVGKAVLEVLAADGVPAGAVEIVVMKPLVPWTSLLDTQRPIKGGLLFTNDANGGCTLGFLAVVLGKAGIITCSHCTKVQGGVEGTIWHQATISGDTNRIGVEVTDPLYFSGSGCPSGRFCRFSDSAFMARNGGPSQSTPRTAGAFGHLAYADHATLTILSDLEIVARQSTPVDGEFVAKVGMASGVTSGQISDTCADFNQDTNDKTLLCQNSVDQTGVDKGGPGDSGSAVFAETGTPISDLAPATLYGLVWGGNDSLFAFSPLPAIELELGAMRVFPGEFGPNSPPEVKIVKPLDFSHWGVGGLNFVDFHADIVDYEGCCSDITWTSDVDGVLGHGPDMTFTFQSAGTRKITVTATDKDGGTASDSIKITAGTSPPSVTIVKPTPSQTLYTGVTNVFSGTSLDPNEPFFSIACGSLTWTSSNPADPFPVTGCNPQVVFQTTGARTLTLTGKDSFGLTATATVNITVATAPASNPPAVTILSPLDNYLLPAQTAVTLTGKAQDPANQNPLTYQWVLIDGPDHTVLGGGTVNSGATITLPWTPADNVYFNCGGELVTLELDVTNANNKTGSATVQVLIGYPPC